MKRLKQSLFFLLALFLTIPAFSQVSWTQLNYQYQTNPYKTRIDVSNDDKIAAYNYQSGGVNADLSTDGGNTWTNMITDRLYKVLFDNQAGVFIIRSIRPTGASTYWPGEVRFTTDKGTSWTYMDTLADGTDQVQESVNREDNRGIMYLGKYRFVAFQGPVYGFKYSEDQGASWNLVEIEDARPYSALKASDGSFYVTSYNSGVYRSTDGGTTWNANTSVGTVTHWDLHEHPVTGDIYMTTAGGIKKTTDNGASWNTVTPNPSIPMNIEKFFLTADGMFYHFGTWGAYESADGIAWNEIWNKNQDGVIEDMAISDQYVYIVSDSSIYRYARQLGTAVDEQETMEQVVTLSPNPVKAVAKLKVNGNQVLNGSVVIYDMHGRMVKSVTGLSGDEVRIDCTELPSGMYFYELKDGKQFFGSGKFVVE